jgi:hypothetical protein
VRTEDWPELILRYVASREQRGSSMTSERRQLVFQLVADFRVKLSALDQKR